jgi:CRISPR system Cascade subunit CasA
MNFNLVSDPWIPVLRSDGRNGLASLLDAFSGSDIVDLNADACERIAITRVLLAIAHRSLDKAGEHPEEFTRSAAIVEKLLKSVPDYLNASYDSFDLGDENKGFLRLPGVTCDKAADKLSTEYLQFHKRQQTRVLTQADLALGIVLFQTCYVGGLGSSNVSWNCVQLSSQNNRSGECPPSMDGGPLYAFVIGETLIQTIARNLLPKSQIGTLGVPVWESVPHNKQDVTAIKNATCTFLGRMVPISFSIIFSPGFHHMGFCQAPYSYQNETQDPWLAYVPDKKSGSTVLRINSEKSLWRELPSITSIPEPGKRRGNLLLQQSRHISGAQVWAGGLSKFQSSVKTLVESRFSVSETMFESLRNEGYLAAFLDSEKTAKRLWYAVKTYVEQATRINPKGSTPIVAEAQMRYWNRLDLSKEILFDLMNKQEPASPWTTHCLQTARKVLTEICDPTTAREFKALSLALSIL